MNELYNEYAAGLYLLAQEEHAEQRWLEQLTGLLALLEEQPQYVRLLDAPMVETSERLALAEQAFGALLRGHAGPALDPAAGIAPPHGAFCKVRTAVRRALRHAVRH